MATDVINTLVSGGIGAALGSIAVAIINTVARKGESRATAADFITNAGVGLVDRLERTNTRLDLENKHLRKALLVLTDVIDEIVDDLPGDDAKMASMKLRLREANREAKMVT